MPFKRVLRRPYGTGVARFAVLLSLVVTTGPVALAVAPSPAVAAPSYTLSERALAIASPSMVYLETIYTGYVRDSKTNQPLLASPITYNRRCSGFVVNSDGTVVTTRNCVAPTDDALRAQVLHVAGNILAGQKQLDPKQVDNWTNAHLATTVFAGLKEGSKPDAKLLAQFNIATGAITDKPAVPGTVVKSSDPDAGDVAVVKLDQGNLAAAELDPNAQLSNGLQLTVLGFNTTDTDPRVGTYTLDNQSVQVVDSDKAGSTKFFRLNKTVGPSYNGGVAIDTSGRVVGIVDADPSVSGSPNRAVFPVSTVTPVLGAAGVHNTLSDSDKLFRSGLDAYFNGKYTTAISNLDKVTNSVPTNRVAPQYRQNAVDRQKIEGDAGSGMPGWLVAVIAAVGGALLAAAIVVLVLRGRSRRKARRRQQETDWEPRYPFPPAPASQLNSGEVPWATPYGPVSAPPTSGPPMPVSGSPTSVPPVSGPPTSVPPMYQQVSGPPMYQPPVSGAPVYQPPVSGPPIYQPDPTTAQPAMHQADQTMAQPAAWPPMNAMPVAPSTVDATQATTPNATTPDAAPAEARPAGAWTPNAWAPEATPQAVPVTPTPPVVPVAPTPQPPPVMPAMPVAPPQQSVAEQSPEAAEPIVWQQRPIRRRPAQDEAPEGDEQPANPWAVPPSQH